MDSGLAERVLEACGTRNVKFYLDSIARLEREFKQYLSSNRIKLSDEITIAKELFDFLFRLRPKRYSEHSHLLTDLLDVYNSERSEGANCTALTALYNILGERLDLHTFVLSPENHILSRIEVNDKRVNVENTIPEGFDIHYIKLFESQPEIYLDELPSLKNDFIVATTYFNSAEKAYHAGDYDRAWELLEKAEAVYPHTTHHALRTQLNRIY